MKKQASQRCPNVARVSILLHDIRSVHNVGSIFRTADAFGVSKIHLSGYTPAPTDRFGRERADIAKVALGAETTVPWESVDADPGNFMKGFKRSGGMIIALEQDARSVSFEEARRKISETSDGTGILLVPGNEVGGVENEFLDLADIIVEIPMLGKKESLNVSVAAGIALFNLAGRDAGSAR